MTTDALFSVNFRLYDSSGIDHQFTIRGDIADEWFDAVMLTKAHLAESGYSATLQASKAGRQVQVDAACMGSFEDKRSGEYKSCIHFYGVNSKFKVATVYPEKFSEVPSYILNAIKQASPRTLDSAPEREKAASMKALVLFAPATVNLEARTDFDGNPLLSESGKPTFKFASFVGGGSKDGVVSTPEAKVSQDLPF